MFGLAILISLILHTYVWQNWRQWDRDRALPPPLEKFIEVSLVEPPPPPPPNSAPLPVVKPLPPAVPIPAKPVVKPPAPPVKPVKMPVVQPEKPKALPVKAPPKVPKPRREVRAIDELAPAREPVEVPRSRPRDEPSERTVSPPKPAEPAVPARPTAPPVLSAKPAAPARESESVTGENASPVAIQKPKPRYPALARQRHMEGRVVVRFRVGADGEPSGCEVAESSGHEGLDSAAQETVCGQWRFKPALQNGKPVARTVTAPIVFKLE